MCDIMEDVAEVRNLNAFDALTAGLHGPGEDGRHHCILTKG